MLVSVVKNQLTLVKLLPLEFQPIRGRGGWGRRILPLLLTIQNKQRRRSSTSIDVSVDMDTLLMNEVGEGTSTPKEICNNVNMMGIMNQCTGDLAFNDHLMWLTCHRTTLRQALCIQR